MGAYRLSLLFKEMPEGEFGPPISQIYVNNYITENYPGEPPDRVYITPRELGEQGIHRAIDELIDELQELKREATKYYQRARNKVQRRKRIS